MRVRLAMALQMLDGLSRSAASACRLVRDRLAFGSEPSAHPPGPRSSPRRRQAVGAVIFAVLLAVYVGDGAGLPGADATANVHLAANLLARGELVYTPTNSPSFFRWTVAHQGGLREVRFRSWDDEHMGRSMRELLAEGALRHPKPPYFLSSTLRPDAYVSNYGAATGLFALPFVAVAAPFVHDLPQRTRLLWLLCKLAAGFAVAASAWLLFQIAVDHLRLSTAVLLTLGYGLGTCVWSVSSQALWQHAPAELCLALGMFGLFRRERRWGAALAGLAFGVAFLCRPTNGLAVAAGFAVLLADRRALLRYVLGATPAAVAFVAYNLHYFGKTIAFGQVSALALRASSGDASALWQHSLWAGVAGLLVSPARGLFVYSPILMVSVWGAACIWRERRWLPLRAAAIASVGMICVSARWICWWGGWSYGYRLVVDVAVLLAFLAIPVLERLRAHRWLALAAALLLVWSVGAQALGVYVYDVAGWNDRVGFVVVRPDGHDGQNHFVSAAEAADFCQRHRCGYRSVHLNIDDDAFNRRLWQVRDSPIVYYLQNLRQSRRQRVARWETFLLLDG